MYERFSPETAINWEVLKSGRPGHETKGRYNRSLSQRHFGLLTGRALYSNSSLFSLPSSRLESLNLEHECFVKRDSGKNLHSHFFITL